MQEYGRVFSEVYDKRWAPFAQMFAPKLLDFYEKKDICQQNKTVLDLCCGPGQLGLLFLEKGYRIIGIDKSPHMISRARKKCSEYIRKGLAEFLEAEAASFHLPQRVGLVVSTFDSLNHLENTEKLAACFGCVYEVLSDQGYFVFDLNTREGLKHWTGMELQEDKELTLIKRGIYTAGMEKAYTQITGFILRENDLYEKFSEVFFNTAFDLSEVLEKLRSSGFRQAYFSNGKDLDAKLAEPEREGRVIAVAKK
jgi:SAM-dependent methyltransferase